jgi:cysteine-rich repeat protein
LLAFFAVCCAGLWCGSPAAWAQLSVCGNATLEPGEECDDGNTLNGDGCTAACTVEQACYDIGNSFSFFTWSDTYPGAGEGAVRDVLTDAVNALKYPQRVIPRFWIGVGDIPFMTTRSTLLDELNDVISDSASGEKYPFTCSASNGKFPYFVALGNHDIDTEAGVMTSQAKYSYWSNTVGPKLAGTLVGIRNFKLGPSLAHEMRTTYSFDYKNAHFIVLNPYHGDPSYPTTAPLGCIRDDLYNWIDADLAATDRPARFVFGHEPAWSYCSDQAGYGGTACPGGHIDNQTPYYRPRPYSAMGPWGGGAPAYIGQPFGLHWGDSLEDSRCPAGSRDRFWRMLAGHNVIAHFVGHSHSYSSRLVMGDGTRRNDISAYNKAGEEFPADAGVWEISHGWVHNSAGSLYVLTTVKDNVVTFEAFDQVGYTEPYHTIEKWSVRIGLKPTVALTAPQEGARFTEGASIILTAAASEPGGQIAQVSFYANGGLLGSDFTSPYSLGWTHVPAGLHSLSAVATDNMGNWAASVPVNIIVWPQNPNRPPVIDPIANQSANEGVLFQLMPGARDPDGNHLTFSLVGPPAGAAINAATGLLTWIPDELQGPGVHILTIRATDNGLPALNTDASFAVAVSEVNVKPVLSNIGAKSASPFSELTFTAVATDADRPVNALSFSLSNAPPGASIDAATGVFKWTPTQAQVGTYNFTVNVADSGSPPLGDSKPVTVTVTDQVLPDLALTAVIFESASVKIGKKLKVSYTVLNQGLAVAEGAKVGFRLSKNATYGDSDDLVISETKSIPKLPPGNSKQDNKDIEVPKTAPSGLYYVCAMADIEFKVAEQNETNNTRCSSAPVNVTP